MTLQLGTFGDRTGRLVVCIVVGLLCLSAVAGVASAQSERTGGTVTIGPDETHDGDLEVTGGEVRIEGTVDGDLTVTGGSVTILGNVTGDLTVTAGSANVGGDVAGTMTATGGDVHVREEATIGSTADVTGGTITIDGTIGGDARLEGDSVTVGPTTRIDGDLTYSGDRVEIDDSATIAGSTTEHEGSGAGPLSDVSLPDVPEFATTPFVGLYLFLANFLLGAVLLLVGPDFSDRVSERGIDRPGLSAGGGSIGLFAAPFVLVILISSLVGIPLAIFAGYNFVLAVWIGLVYGAFIVGTWALSLFDRAHRWGALAVGLAIVSLVNALPHVGVLLVVIALLGLGAFVHTGYVWRTGKNGNDGDPDRSDSTASATNMPS